VSAPWLRCSFAFQLFESGYQQRSWIRGNRMAPTGNRRRLGYRFRLRSASVASAAQQGQNLPLNLHIENVGFAAMYNARPVWLVLSNGLNRYEMALTGQAFDPRRCSGATMELVAQVRFRLRCAGTYQLSLWLPDPHPDLRETFAMRFASPTKERGTRFRGECARSFHHY